MELQQPSPASKLVQLPDELLLNVLWLTDDAKDAANLARTCKRLYYPLVTDAWKKAGPESDWCHLFEAIENNNFPSFKKWLALAPVDHNWSEHKIRPLHMAILYHRPAMVKLILDNGANPNFIESDILSGGEEYRLDWISPLHHAIMATLVPRFPKWSSKKKEKEQPNVTLHITPNPPNADSFITGQQFTAALPNLINLGALGIVDDAVDTIPKKDLGRKRKQKVTRIRRRWELQVKGRQMITALRLAGADESALDAAAIFHDPTGAFIYSVPGSIGNIIGAREREHLDSIEAGEPCCDRHKVFKKSF